MPEFRVYPSRWLMVLLFGLLTMANAMIWISFAPISDFAQEHYMTSVTGINGLSISFQILYLPASVLVSFVLSKWGLRKGLLLGALLQALASWIRLLSLKDDRHPRGGTTGYYILLIGQCIGGIAQPFFTNSPARLASTWFAIEQRDLATTLCSMLNPVGIALGQVLPPLLVKKDSAGVTGMAMLLFTQALVANICLVLTFIFFQERPPTPPSMSQMHRADADHSDIKAKSHVMQDLKTLFTDKNYLILFFGFGGGLGFFNGLTTVIEQIIKPCNYNSDNAGNFGALIIGAGLVGCGIVGPIMDHYHVYNKALKIGFLAAWMGWFFFLEALRPNHGVLVGAAFGVLGLFMMPILPVSFECAVECTYPIAEETSCGLLMCAGNISGIIMTLVLSSLIDRAKTFNGVWTPVATFVFIFMGVGSLLMFVYSGPYKRLSAEKDDDNDIEEDLVVEWR